MSLYLGYSILFRSVFHVAFTYSPKLEGLNNQQHLLKVSSYNTSDETKTNTRIYS